MKFIYKLERKFGKYAIHELPAIVIALYVAGYLLSVGAPNILNYCRLDPYYILHGGQIWRIITWLIVPPSSLDIFTIIMLFFYYSIAKVLSRTWGDFLFNVYIFGGVILTVIGSFLIYLIALAVYGQPVAGIGYYISTYYINMSIFLAFAVTYPNMEVLLYFFIPVKMKWMGILYGALIAYDFYRTNWVGRCVIVISLLNWFIYFLMTRNLKSLNPTQMKRRAQFNRTVRAQKKRESGSTRENGSARGSAGTRSTAGTTVPFPKVNRNTTTTSTANTAPRHRCVVCGRTELDDPNLEFRYCSKCEGNYEYCQDHLFTHEHVKKS